ncbi:hypothetical protein PAAG_02785 [Paracoccidioides lutzii Pb01]|uniref:Uncharacterized protein n=1 Tax=Paracoccidioides lutzii (strain ATCC MYA-826 / Pb01) TaxID=502779 RepID=C1GW90_PARBA|nr:hypothetical protein PAAG_02785 [Paracoccidioides lutzii Pb01]EEH40809.2 hypothetical protein PAAG_02785 [Paracoccidioides lutzii Pb01]
MEWACSLPVEMVEPPHWLTDKGVNQIVLKEYNRARLGFMNILTSEEENSSYNARQHDETVGYHEPSLGDGNIPV